MGTVDLNKMSAEEKEALLKQLSEEKKASKLQNRIAYEGIRAEFLAEIRDAVNKLSCDVVNTKAWIDSEAEAFKEVMQEYGQLKKKDQRNMTISDDNFKMVVASNDVKGFDERANVAAERLMDYLRKWVEHTEQGIDDPMYQLAMSLLQRNKRGMLDNKNISKLYELEGKFDVEYSEIMELFRESNTVTTQALNYYFYERDKDGVWQKIEPSFCRI